MRRFAVALGVLAAMAVPAVAGSTSASFHVGITILPPSQSAATGLHGRGHVSRSPFLRSLTAPKGYTWGAASVALARAGFSRFARESQLDFVYFFKAERAGESFRVAVSATTGAILKIWALPT